MRGFGRFLEKEFVEIARTWRLPVIASAVLLFAVTGPILAKLTPQLLESVQVSQPGVVISVPDPTWRDSYLQWVKNLSQIVAFVTIIVAAGSVAGEVASGTATLVLSKPVSRAGFVAAKAITLYSVVAVTVAAGTGVTQGITALVFGEAPTADLWQPTALWLAFAALLVAVAVLLSSLMSTLAAAGVGIGVYFALSLGALWGPLVRYTPIGLMTGPTDLLAGKDPALFYPVVTSLGLALLFVCAGAALFARREL